MSSISLVGVRSQRRGFVMPIVLIAMIAAGAILLGMVRAAATRKAAFDLAIGRCQASSLAESGLERAAARLHADPAYSGEIWRLPAEADGGFRGATVTIHVEQVSDRPNVRRIHAAADCPDDPLYRVHCEKQAMIAVKAQEPQE